MKREWEIFDVERVGGSIRYTYPGGTLMIESNGDNSLRSPEKFTDFKIQSIGGIPLKKLCMCCENPATHEENWCAECYKTNVVWDVLGIPGGYSSTVDELVYLVLEAHYFGKRYVDEVLEYVSEHYEESVDQHIIELVNYILCGGKVDGELILEYGTSPRGAWLTPTGKRWWGETRKLGR